MKYCPACGAQCADDAMSCPFCGITPAPPPAYQNPYEIPYQSAAYAAQPIAPPQAAVKKAAASPLFMAAAAAYTLSLLLSIVNAFRVNSMLERVFDLLGEWIPDFTEAMEEAQADMPFDFSRLMGSSAAMGTLIGLIPLALICIGLWMVYASAKKDKDPAPRTTGLGLIMGVTIYNLVGIGFAVLVVLGVVGLMAILSVADGEAMIAIIFGAILIPFAGLMGVFIGYYVSAIRAISSVKRTAAYGREMPKVSGFLPVMMIISAIASLVSAAFSAILAGALGALAALLSGVAVLLLAVLLFNFRQSAKEQEYAQQQVAYYAPPPTYGQYTGNQ